ncbi:MAG TPA: bifunctional diguanylate cyclase/phosphodiesterase [Kineosporiaceae bacterium]|nr:bifunctional diguanylate cyclase/phosphodiesterase [Kineosporiaceae bacterium]
MTLASGELRYDRVKRAVTRVATLVCVTATLFVFVDHQGPYPTTMFYPPVGVVFGYLILRGPSGIAATTMALLLGNAITLPRQFAADPLAEVGYAVMLSVLLAITAYPLHGVRRRLARNTPAFAVLTLFVLTGLLAAPLLTAAGTWALAMLIGPSVQSDNLAQMVLGLATAIAALTPATVVSGFLLLGPPPAVLRSRFAGRREALVPAAVIVLVPILALALPGAGVHELWLLPLASMPLIWIAGTGDLIRSGFALAIGALLLGTVTRGLFGDDTELYRAQLMVLGCSLATLYVAAACLTEAATQRQESAATTRWRALLAAAPAKVSRIAADGSWQSEFDLADAGTTGAALPEPEQAEVAAALRDRHPRTLRWQSGDPDRRNFVTRVTPLPDGETLVVTTETTLADVAEAALAWERTHDRETRLPNRDLLLATAERALAAGTPAFLLVIDFDQIVRRALLLGADGPTVLRELAGRIHAIFDPSVIDLTTLSLSAAETTEPAADAGLVAWTGDDQLSVLVPGAEQIDPARGSQLLQAVSSVLDLEVGRLSVHGSVGMATVAAPVQARDALRQAAVAAQTSRERGEATIVISDGLSIRNAAEHARLVGDVIAAVERGELEVVYQPDVHPEHGTLQGLEALVRWRRRDGFSVSTDDFVRMAEEAGAVAAIDDWVMRASLAQLGTWRREINIDGLELGINVSALSLTSDLPQRLDDACRGNGVPPGRVRVEVTETVLGDDSKAVEVLREIRALGFRIGLDDFGTGYASLSRLRSLPVDVIKLDRSFLASIAEDPATQTLVGMILGLAEPLHLDVVVEGVETQAQCDVLVELGCQRVQGFLFSPPAGAVAIREILLEAGLPRGLITDPAGEHRIADQLSLTGPLDHGVRAVDQPVGHPVGPPGGVAE